MTRGVRHAMSTCTAPNCDKRPKSRGLCQTHYARWKRNGHIELTVMRGVPDVERFWHHANRTTAAACWPWGSEIVRGYGRFKLTDGSRIMAHRYAYELTVGPIPDGLTIDHLCNVGRCVNPSHMEPVTVQENIRRRDERRRST